MNYLFNSMISIGSIPVLLLLADWILDWPLFDIAEDIIGGWIWVGVWLLVVGFIGNVVISAIND